MATIIDKPSAVSREAAERYLDLLDRDIQRGAIVPLGERQLAELAAIVKDVKIDINDDDDDGEEYEF